MRNLVLVSTLAVFGLSSGALAHPGPKLLTTGNGDRTAMTAGMTYEDINGVHVFRGSKALLGDDPAPKAMRETREIEIVIKHRPWRRLRKLRTQGFFSGVPYPSRRYTQGFYSGD